MNETKLFLNTWGAYNNGSIGYGWMTANEAREFIDNNPERDGGEWFIADIDNYLGIDFGELEYTNIDVAIEAITTLNDMQEWEQKEIVAVMEYIGSYDVFEAIYKRDNHYIIYSDINEYHESCDESINFNGCDELIERYFDYEAFHRDCDYDIYKASNGVCILE